MNNIEKLRTIGLRQRYFRKVTPKDISIKIEKQTSMIKGTYIEIMYSIGIHKDWFSLDDIKNAQSFITTINNFNKTKDISYIKELIDLLISVTPSGIEDGCKIVYPWFVIKLQGIYSKLYTGKEYKGMSFGLLNKEGVKFIKRVDISIDETMSSMRQSLSTYKILRDDLKIFSRSALNSCQGERGVDIVIQDLECYKELCKTLLKHNEE